MEQNPEAPNPQPSEQPPEPVPLEKLVGIVAGRLRNGADKETIIHDLIDNGVDRKDAPELANTLRAKILQAAAQERFRIGGLAPAMLGGILAAAAGGLIWGLVAVHTGYEIGYLAWGLGILSGLAVVRLTRGQKGMPLQLIAVLASVLGIAVGKYFTFHHYLREYLMNALAEGKGDPAVVNPFLPLLSPPAMLAFVQNLGSMANPYDILWIGLAVASAWRIPKSMGIRVSESEFAESRHFAE